VVYEPEKSESLSKNLKKKPTSTEGRNRRRAAGLERILCARKRIGKKHIWSTREDEMLKTGMGKSLKGGGRV